MGEPAVPLSHLALDVPTPPLGWEVELDARGVVVFRDDLGRLSIDRDDARRLVAEHHEQQEAVARRLKQIEERAIEQDQAFRASLPRGVPAGAVPEGVSPALLMMAADPMGEGSRRETVLEHALRHQDGAIVYHSIEGAASGAGGS